MIIRSFVVFWLVVWPFALALADQSGAAKTYTADDVRAAFRLGLIQGAKQEHDHEVDAALAEVAKSAKSILPVLQKTQAN